MRNLVHGLGLLIVFVFCNVAIAAVPKLDGVHVVLPAHAQSIPNVATVPELKPYLTQPSVDAASADALRIAGSLRMHGSFVVSSDCIYANDNGCAFANSAIQALPGKSAATAGYKDANFAVDADQSGQLVSSASGAQIAVLTAAFHTNNDNFAYETYHTGSELPANLRAISNFNTDFPVGAGTLGVNPMQCHLYSNTDNTGPLFATWGNSGIDYVYCRNTTGTVTSASQCLCGYDWTNEGSGTGTAFVILQPTAAPTTADTNTLQVVDNYWLCTSACQAYGGIGFIIQLGNAGGTGGVNAVAHFYAHNNTFDGAWQTWNHKTTPGGVWILVGDGRGNGTTSTATYDTDSKYNIILNSGHDMATGLNGGTQIWDYNTSMNGCSTLGFTDSVFPGLNPCHGELTEVGLHQGANRLHVAYEYIGNVTVWPSCGYGSVGAGGSKPCDVTASYYPIGLANGIIVDQLTIKDNLVIRNYLNCTNSGPSVGSTNGYTANNQCSLGSSGTGGSSLLATLWNPYIVSADIERNIVSSIGAAGQYANQDTGAQAPGSQTYHVAGTTYSVDAPSLSDPKRGQWFWPGNAIRWCKFTGSGYCTSAAPGGWVNTYIPYPNTGTADAFSTFSGSTTSGVLTAGVSLNLIVGNNVYNTGSGVVGAVVSGSGMVWTLTGSVSTAGPFYSFNNTLTAQAGITPGAGTYILHDSEPTVTQTTDANIVAAAHFDSLTISNNYEIGQAWTGSAITPTLITFTCASGSLAGGTGTGPCSG